MINLVFYGMVGNKEWSGEANKFIFERNVFCCVYMVSMENTEYPTRINEDVR